jgi:uncharacterized protein YmfQ (DUF2313 family)
VIAVDERTEQMLGDLMPELADSDDVRQVVRLSGLELERLEGEARGLSESVLPTRASDEYRTLPMWETLLGLPVEPAGATVEQRRALVTASVQKLRAGSGADWVAAITQALGTTTWDHEEGPADYQITIRTPYEPGGLVPGQVAVMARRVTPAHLTIATGFTTGFLVGVSDIGDVL